MEVLYTKFGGKLLSQYWDEYMDLLPYDLKEQNARYMRWEDRHAHLFGKLLLVEGFRKYGFGHTLLSELKYNNFGKPYLNNNIGFNISHSGEYVVCAIGKDMRMGIDIEKIKDINLSDFEYVMTHQQWKHIHAATDSLKTFFQYWTIKESVVKADSRGLSIPLIDIHVNNNIVKYEGQIWYLKELNLDTNLSACLAISTQNPVISLIKIDFWDESMISHNSSNMGLFT